MTSALDGKRILITRERKQAKYFSKVVKEKGGIPVEVPLLKITVVDQKENLELLRNWRNYEWIFFTSANGVHYYFQLLNKYGIDTASFDKKKIAAVGHKTENALKEYHYDADFIPTIYDAETMAKEFFQLEQTEGPVLIVRGSRSRDVLPRFFTDHNIPFDMVTVYQTIYNDESEERLNDVLQKNAVDYISFTSPSTVEAFVKMADFIPDKLCVCIGTTTENRAKELGFHKLLTPKQFTVDAMVDVLADYIAKEG